MEIKKSIPYEIRMDNIKKYLNGTKRMTQICTELQISRDSFHKWLAKYESLGAKSLRNNRKNTIYPTELKLAAVRDYLSGGGSHMDIVKKYKIIAKTTLQGWIKRYNGHEIIEFKNNRGENIMTVGRKTTYEERLEIVSFCIANNENYQLTSDKFLVSYQQVYTWTKKYKVGGLEALTDNRGRHKGTDRMTENEDPASQIKRLEAENERLKMEVGFLKKLKEVERRRDGKINISRSGNTTRRRDFQ